LKTLTKIISKFNWNSEITKLSLQSRRINRYANCFKKSIEIASSSLFSWQFSKISLKMAKRTDLPRNDLYVSTVTPFLGGPVLFATNTVVYYILANLYSTWVQYSVQSTVYRVQCTEYSVQSTVYRVSVQYSTMSLIL